MFSLSPTISKRLIWGIALALPLAAAGPGAAETVKGLQRDARRVERELRDARESAAELDKRERSIAGDLDRMARELNRARRAARDTAEALENLDGRIAEAEAAFETLSRRLREGRERAATRAVSLYKLQALGSIHLLASAGSVGEFFERRTALRRVLARDETLLDELGARQAELDLLAAEIQTIREKRQAAARERQRAAARLNAARTARRGLLARVRKEKSLAAEAVAALTDAAAALDRRIRALEAEIRARNRVRDRARKQAKAAAGTGAFARHKGLLNMPATGKITTFFGPFENPEFGVRNFQSGIVIRTEPGAPVRSVGDGEVIYAGWFKGYGNMIILDHGDHYYTLYAHAGELFKGEGDIVRSGEVIASAGHGGAMEGSGLHFEVRHHGKPLDPMEWLKTG
ncbi:MAG: murein hydrolase activator EnvC family protein [Desulfococcaceae bacterium]